MAIKSVQVVNMAAAKTNPPDVKVAFSKERIEKYVNILKKADPTIQNLDVSFEEKELSRKKSIMMILKIEKLFLLKRL